MMDMADIEMWLLPETHTLIIAMPWCHIKKIPSGRPLNLMTISFTSFTFGPDRVLYKITLLKYINLKL